MASKKMTLFLSTRLQQALGPAGGFGASGIQEGEGLGLGLSRRANMLGDRYQALIDHADIKSFLSLEQLLRLAELVGPFWDGPAFKINDLAHVIAVKLGSHIDTIDSAAGVSMADLELVHELAAMSFVQCVAAVEWIERHCFSDKSATLELAASKSANFAATFTAISPKKIFKSALMGLQPGSKACAEAVHQLDVQSFTRDRAPTAHRVLASMANGVPQKNVDILDALKEIGGQ